MLGDRRWKGIKPIGAYLPKTLKFYGIKNEKLTPTIFIIILVVSFVANLLQMNLTTEIVINPMQMSTDELIEILKVLMIVNGITLGTFVITNLVSSAYLYAYIKDLKGIGYTFRECWKVLGRKIVLITVLSILNVLAVFTGLFVFIIPGIVIYIMFIFSNCYMMDKNKGIIASLKSSVDLTNGCKGQIFGVIFMFNLLIILIPMFLGFGGGPLIYAFISAFVSAIVNLMYQRLIALMYVDLEYPALRGEEMKL